jgi:hypothetical protein
MLMLTPAERREMYADGIHRAYVKRVDGEEDRHLAALRNIGENLSRQVDRILASHGLELPAPKPPKVTIQ